LIGIERQPGLLYLVRSGPGKQGTVAMVDDSPEDTTPPDSGRAKRAPPTIDLEASKVSGETHDAGAAGAEAPPKRPLPGPSTTISAALIAAVTGAGAAALVIASAWFAGWPAVGPTAAPQPDAAVIDGLAARIAGIESKTDTPLTSASDSAAAARIEALEKSVVSLRSELSAARAQSTNLEAAVNDFKSAPRDPAPPPDLSAIDERLSRIEQATRAETKPADDAPLRRVVVAALLDISVRQGEPYTAALAAAKSLSADADALKPLDGFAATGVPSAASLSRELLTLVPKLSPPARQNTASGSGIIDRLQAGAARLVRIERTDGVGNDRGAVEARITAAALRNDSNEARRELNTLAPADRAAAQSWIDKSDARDAALAASRQFASDAMAALAQVRQ
jgi:hypothetical protein